jgi:PAS domain S-box-containing protein
MKGASKAMNLSGKMLNGNNYPVIALTNQESIFTHALLNSSKNAAFCIGAGAEFLYVNNAFCQMNGYSREELMSMTLADLDIDFSPKVWLEHWELLKRQDAVTRMSHYQNREEQIFPVEITFNSVEADQEFCCAFAREISSKVTPFTRQRYVDNLEEGQEDLRQEVSEYKIAQAELEKSLSLLRATLESTANGILAVNFEGEILCFNQKFMDMWQIPRSVRISRRCDRAKDFFESQVKDPEVFRACVWQMPSQLDSESYDLVELKDGRIFAHYSEPQWLGDKVIGRVWSIWDITETQRTEDALRLNESRFRTLAETTDAGIFLMFDNQLCYANPAAATLTGYTQQELLSKLDVNQLIRSRELRQVHKPDGATLSEYQEMQIVMKNGTSRWLACTVGKLDGLIDFSSKSVELITAIDITDYKHAESEVRQALEQAKRVSELRQRFVSMLCHQFRTPLNVVSFSADLLRRNSHQWTEEKNRSYLDLIQAATKQIAQLLDEILLFAKAEAAKLKYEPRLLDLDQFCRDIVAQMQLVSNDPQSIKFVNKGKSISANADPKLLQHILMNLLSNSLKYSPGGGPVTLEICCQNQQVVFQIKDQGIGIPVVDRAQLFEPFYRGSNVDSIPGSGLGLSIVQTLVELHSGEVMVESEVGVGTTFTIVLPCNC